MPTNLLILTSDTVFQTRRCLLVLANGNWGGLMRQVLSETKKKAIYARAAEIDWGGRERHIVASLALLIDHMEINT